jgi:hypothetical protein
MYFTANWRQSTVFDVYRVPIPLPRVIDETSATLLYANTESSEIPYDFTQGIPFFLVDLFLFLFCFDLFCFVLVFFFASLILRVCSSYCFLR